MTVPALYNLHILIALYLTGKSMLPLNAIRCILTSLTGDWTVCKECYVTTRAWYHIAIFFQYQVDSAHVSIWVFTLPVSSV